VHRRHNSRSRVAAVTTAVTIAVVSPLFGCGGPPLIVPAPPPTIPAAASSPAGRAALALAASTPTLSSSIQVKDDTVRRPIHGATMAEIASELGVDRTNSDSDYDGTTATSVQWQFAQTHLGDSCAITQIIVTLEVETRLPTWVRPAHAAPTLAQQWARFLEATERHENGHRNIALHTAVAIGQSLGDEHGLPCVELDQLANASARAQWELGNQHQLTYDIATRHGETQGSRWPPFIGSP